MRKLIESATRRLRAFVSQRDDFALVVSTPEVEATSVLAICEELSETSTAEFFWIFPDPFSGPEVYASAIVKGFAAKHELVKLLQEKEGSAPWPPIPPAILDEAAPAEQRLRELMVFSRSLLPAPENCLAVWVFFPMEISDAAGYGRLMSRVVEHEFPLPWCHHLRVIMRENPAQPGLAAALKDTPRVGWYQPDFSPAALQQALDEAAADKDLPLDERLQSLLVAAGMDYSNKRYDEALEKYQLVFQHYSATKNNVLTAIALNGLGEVHVAQGQQEDGGTCLEAAVVAATEAEPPSVPVFFNAAWNLANLRVAQGRWEEAESYFDVVQKLAAVQHSPELKIAAIEQLGQTQYMQAKVPLAVETWQAGATVAEKLEKPELRRSILGRMKEHYVRAGDTVKQREIDAALADGKPAA
ncbi:MAG: tetratricopeptide repeat protein [Thermoguttaceae bacterium]